MTDSPKGQRNAAAQRRARSASVDDLEATGVNEFRFIDLGEVALSQEKTGFDPYNSTHGKPNIDAWKRR